MQRGFSLRDLHLRRREIPLFATLLDPAREEGLTAAVVTPNGLESSVTGLHVVEHFVDCCLEAVQSDGKFFQATARNSAPAECLEDLLAFLRADYRCIHQSLS